MKIMSDKLLVAELPPMRSEDLKRFEAEGGIWGKQRAVRRRQVNATMFGAALAAVSGALWVFCIRRNTLFVLGGSCPVFTLTGALAGHALGISLYPSVADNKETTLMRRVWWAKQCAKEWNMSQVDKGKWVAQYPHVHCPK